MKLVRHQREGRPPALSTVKVMRSTRSRLTLVAARQRLEPGAFSLEHPAVLIDGTERHSDPGGTLIEKRKLEPESRPAFALLEEDLKNGLEIAVKKSIGGQIPGRYQAPRVESGRGGRPPPTAELYQVAPGWGWRPRPV